MEGVPSQAVREAVLRRAFRRDHLRRQAHGYPLGGLCEGFLRRHFLVRRAGRRRPPPVGGLAEQLGVCRRDSHGPLAQCTESAACPVAARRRARRSVAGAGARRGTEDAARNAPPPRCARHCGRRRAPTRVPRHVDTRFRLVIGRTCRLLSASSPFNGISINEPQEF